MSKTDLADWPTHTSNLPLYKGLGVVLISTNWIHHNANTTSTTDSSITSPGPPNDDITKVPLTGLLVRSCRLIGGCEEEKWCHGHWHRWVIRISTGKQTKFKHSTPPDMSKTDPADWPTHTSNLPLYKGLGVVLISTNWIHHNANTTSTTDSSISSPGPPNDDITKVPLTGLLLRSCHLIGGCEEDKWCHGHWHRWVIRISTGKQTKFKHSTPADMSKTDPADWPTHKSNQPLYKGLGVVLISTNWIHHNANTTSTTDSSILSPGPPNDDITKVPLTGLLLRSCRLIGGCEEDKWRHGHWHRWVIRISTEKQTQFKHSTTADMSKTDPADWPTHTSNLPLYKGLGVALISTNWIHHNANTTSTTDSSITSPGPPNDDITKVPLTGLLLRSCRLIGGCEEDKWCHGHWHRWVIRISTGKQTKFKHSTPADMSKTDPADWPTHTSNQPLYKGLGVVLISTNWIHHNANTTSTTDSSTTSPGSPNDDITKVPLTGLLLRSCHLIGGCEEDKWCHGHWHRWVIRISTGKQTKFKHSTPADMSKTDPADWPTHTSNLPLYKGLGVVLISTNWILSRRRLHREYGNILGESLLFMYWRKSKNSPIQWIWLDLCDN